MRPKLNYLDATMHTMFGGHVALHITPKTPYQQWSLEVETWCGFFFVCFFFSLQHWQTYNWWQVEWKMYGDILDKNLLQNLLPSTRMMKMKRGSAFGPKSHFFPPSFLFITLNLLWTSGVWFLRMCGLHRLTSNESLMSTSPLEICLCDVFTTYFTCGRRHK